MKLFAIAAVLGLATPSFSYTHKYTLSADAVYDDGHTSLSKVTCAHGEHGLLTHGHTTFENLPTFPYIGGAPQILNSESSYCGSCWELTYTYGYGAHTRLNFTAIAAGGHGSDMFTISEMGFDHLTHGEGEDGKSVSITAVKKPASWCGL